MGTTGPGVGWQGPLSLESRVAWGGLHWGAYMSVLATVAQGTWQAAS